MDRDLLQIHRLLDAELTPEEERDILQKMEDDPRLQEVFDGLVRTMDIMKSPERLPVDAAFGAEVMNRLPLRGKPLKERVANFLFGERVLRWNVATFTAVSAVIVLILVASLAYLTPGKNGLISDNARQVNDAVKTVTLTFHAPGARAVSLAGDFNKWSVEEGAMKKRSDGTWFIELPLNPGVYHYMFVINGEGWVPDPAAESYRDDGFGNKNAILRVNSI